MPRQVNGIAKKDHRLMRRAIKNRWPITEVIRAETIDKVRGVLSDTEEPRHILAAAKVLVDADKVNMIDAANKIKQQEADAAAKRPLEVFSLRVAIAEQCVADATYERASAILRRIVDAGRRDAAGPGDRGDELEVHGPAAPVDGQPRIDGLNGKAH